jgi:small subunit ribosomal protein S4
MARYTGSVCRLCRREGIKLYLKGERCYTDKCAIDRRAYAPGQHGQARKKVSEYGVQLREKQKARRVYGVLEKQFRSYYEEASRRAGITGETLLQILESRLDNVVYRLGFGASRPEARQIVKHGHILVNGKRVDIPSYQTKPGDVISFGDKSLESPRVKELLEAAESKAVVTWLERDLNTKTARIVRVPARDEIDVPVQNR